MEGEGGREKGRGGRERMWGRKKIIGRLAAGKDESKGGMKKGGERKGQGEAPKSEC